MNQMGLYLLLLHTLYAIAQLITYIFLFDRPMYSFYNLIK